MPVHLAAFVVTTGLLAMIPGAGQALMLRQTLVLGRRAAWATIAGTCTGLVLWSAAAAAGLSAVLLANPTAYTVLRLAGAVVLGYLGMSSLRAMWSSRNNREPEVLPSARRNAFLAGLSTNLSNPKAGVFAISFIPQFIEPPGPVFASAMLLGLIWAATTAAWYVIFVFAVHHGRRLVSHPSVTTWLQGITGVILIGLGVAVAFGV